MYLDFAAAFILIICIIRGEKKGVIESFASAFGWLFSLFFTFLYSPVLAEYITENTHAKQLMSDFAMKHVKTLLPRNGRFLRRRGLRSAFQPFQRYHQFRKCSSGAAGKAGGGQAGRDDYQRRRVFSSDHRGEIRGSLYRKSDQKVPQSEGRGYGGQYTGYALWYRQRRRSHLSVNDRAHPYSSLCHI